MSVITNIDSHWHHHFYDMQYSSQLFYEQVTKGLKQKELPGISVGRINFFEGGILSARREYLRIMRCGYVFDICAAPFGKEFFVSWWAGDIAGCMPEFVARIPIVGRLMLREYKKTYYQMDTDVMFKETVHNVVMEIIDIITKEKSVRQLAENERVFQPFLNA